MGRIYHGAIWRHGDSVAFHYRQRFNLKPEARGIVRRLNRSNGMVTIDSPEHGLVRVHSSCVSHIREGV